MDTMEKSENLSLLEYINKNCAYVDKNEQEEIEALNIDFDDLTSSDCEQADIGRFLHYRQWTACICFDIGARGDAYKKPDVWWEEQFNDRL